MTTPAPIAASFSYRLLKQASPSAPVATDGLMEVYPAGLLEDQQRRYYLEISAQSGLGGDIGLASVDLTLSFNAAPFNPVVLGDVALSSSPLSQFQRRAVLNGAETSSIRFAAASVEAIRDAANQPLGEAIRATPRVLGYVAFDLNDAALTDLLQNEGYLADNVTKRTRAAGFQLTANLDETVFTDLSSLRDKQAAGYAYASTGVEAKAAAVTLQLSQQAAHQFGTQRSISLEAGNSGFTNLIREGDTVFSTVVWKNSGDVSVTGIQVTTQALSNATLSVQSKPASISVGARAADGSIIEANRQSGTITLSLTAGAAAAGTVIDTSQGAYTITEASTYFDWVGKGSKNLVTYQGDLNYDGRVSMKDLAFLNAGAAQQAATGTLAGDVDANHDGAFSIADLVVLQNQWGKSLHTGSGTFRGQKASLDPASATLLSWQQLSQQAPLNEQGVAMAMQWNNQSFDTQNSIEASAGFDPFPMAGS